MTDHSAILQFVKDPEIDCIPGAMSAHAVCTSSATARLITPRKRIEIVPVLDPAIGVAAIRDRYQKEVCHGNARAAKLLQRLIFRYLPEENGKARLRTYRYNSFWWEKSYEDWAAELDATVKQVRTDFAKLKEWGLAEARPLKVYEGKNAGKTVTHCRVFAADGAASLSGWPDYSQLRIVLGCPNGHSIASPIWAFHSDAQMGIHKAKEEVPQKEKGKGEENIKDTNEQPFVKSSTPAKPDKAAGKAIQKQTPIPVKTAPDKQPQPATPEDFPDKYLTMPSKEAMQEWERLEVEYNTTVAIEAAKAEAKGEKIWGKPCVLLGWPKPKLQALQRFEFEVTKAGHDPLVILKWLTTFRWWKTSAAVGDYGIYDALPNPLYLKAHWKGFLAAYIASEFVPSIKASSKHAFKRTKGGIKGMHYTVLAAIYKAGKPPTVPDVPATPEEVEALMAEYAQPATVPAPVVLEAHAVVTTSASASLTTGSPLPVKKPAPQKPKPLPTSKLDELKKHKQEQEAAAKAAAEVARKKMVDATFQKGWLTA